jgi:caa(3)-type oxidase subunit IV
MSASHSHDGHQVDGLGHHVASIQTYIAVFGVLLVFTVLTYAVSFADLGPLAFPVAMLVASVKAGLVCAYFMHLKYDERLNLLVFASSLFFVGVFIFFLIVDYSGRGAISPEEGYYYWGEQQAAAEQAAAPAAAPTEAAEGAGDE